MRNLKEIKILIAKYEKCEQLTKDDVVALRDYYKELSEMLSPLGQAYCLIVCNIHSVYERLDACVPRNMKDKKPEANTIEHSGNN